MKKTSVNRLVAASLVTALSLGLAACQSNKKGDTASQKENHFTVATVRWQDWGKISLKASLRKLKRKLR